MPHDRNGRELKAGDRVLVPCVVREVYSGEEFCNVTLDTVEPMFPGEHRTALTLNARQVLLEQGEGAPAGA